MWQSVKKSVAKVLNINVVETSPQMQEESFLEWLGIKRENTSEPVHEVTYFTCLKMMSETMAKMPWKFYERTRNGIKEAEDTDVSKLMKDRPNPFMTPTTFWNTVEMNRCHFGNAYVYVRRKFKRKKYGGELTVLDMWIMPSNCVKIVVDDKGYFGGAGKIWYVYSDKYSGQQYVFSTDEVLHFKTSHSLDGITGLPVQYILKSTVEGTAASQDFLNNLYKNGLTAKATLEYTGDLDETAKEKLIQAFETYGSGTKNTGKILPVPLGMKLTPLDIKLSDSQFIELKKYSALQIAAAFGIKPNQINDYEKSSYSNSEMQQLSFYVDTMLFVMKQYEEEVNYKLLDDEDRESKYFKLNEKVLLRTDSKTQMEIFASSVNNGIQMPNECRRKLDLMDAEGGDQLIVNGSYIPLNAVGQQYGVTDEEEEQEEETPEQQEETSESTETQVNEESDGQEEQEGEKKPNAEPDESIEQQKEETEEPEENEGNEDESEDAEKKPEQETAETEGEGEEEEGGEDDDEEKDELHKKKS